ncbi:tetratricopeptide repeat protein [bacterium]|nr:tetratricopeptide repeat protein [bacterium]
MKNSKWKKLKTKAVFLNLLSLIILSMTFSCFLGEPKLSPAYDFVKKGDALLEQGDLDEAISMYHKALEYDPEFGAAYLGLGRVWLKKDTPIRARLFLHKAIQLDKELTAVYGYLGDIYYDQGEFERAIEYYRKCKPTDPIYIDARYKIGNHYLEHGEFEKAEKEFRLVLENTEHWGAYWGLGRIFREKGDLEKANEMLMSAYKLRKDPNICFDLGLILAELDRPETAYLLLKIFTNANGNKADKEIIDVIEELENEYIGKPNTSDGNKLMVDYNLKCGEKLEVSIYNLDGSKVRMIFKGYLSRGNYKWDWDGKNDSGNSVPYGIYLANIDGESFIYTTKVQYMN